MPLTANERAHLLALYHERVAEYADADLGQRWLRWCRQLLDHGGELVVPPRNPEPDLDVLLAGAVSFAARTRFVGGDENECHANVAALWVAGQVDAIGTGYALSDDGLWRQHSWGVDADGTVVETTFDRLAYVGIALPPGPPAVLFALRYAGGPLKQAIARGDARARALAEMMRGAARPGG